MLYALWWPRYDSFPHVLRHSPILPTSPFSFHSPIASTQAHSLTSPAFPFLSYSLLPGWNKLALHEKKLISSYIWAYQSKTTELLEETSLAFYLLSSYWFSQTLKQFCVLSHIPLTKCDYTSPQAQNSSCSQVTGVGCWQSGQTQVSYFLRKKKKSKIQEGSKSKSLPRHMPFPIHQ